MTAPQLQKELKRVERRILRVTGDPFHKNWRYWRWTENGDTLEKVKMMMLDRSAILDRLFEKHCTPTEVARAEKVNDLLLDLTRRTYSTVARVYRGLLTLPRDERDDNCEVEGKLVPDFTLPHSVLRLEDDDWYGSDFIRMAEILHSTEEDELPLVHERIYLDPTHTPDMTDEQLGIVNEMDNGTSWAEAVLHHPALEHINFCHAFHALCTHINYSLVDALRINEYNIEVALTVSQATDQDGNRLFWHDEYDFPKFCDGILRQANSRPEGMSPEVSNLSSNGFTTR